MSDDRQLLRSFVAERSEAAFGRLVARHLSLVYSAALRQTGGDTHLSQDIAQVVFVDLARKSPALSENVVLAGWLHRATTFAARQMMRSERRRHAREEQAVTNAKVFVLAMHVFAQDNQQQSPTNFNQIAQIMGGTRLNGQPLDTAQIGDLSNQFAIVYQGSLTNIASPSTTLVIQGNSWQTDQATWAKVYGFADGHVEVHAAPDGNFGAFEQQHTVPPLTAASP